MIPGTLEENARRVGGAHWVEQRCFEMLGGWVRSTPEPEAKLLFARQSHHHAWHAELFERLLPEANGFAADDLIAPPNAAWAAVLDRLAALAATADRLAAVYRLLVPAKLAAYERWHAGADPVRDGPLRRWLGFVVADERADLGEGRALLDRRVGGQLGPTQAELAAVLEQAGPLLP